jgi:predicted DNA-binding mobile mystery protein A
MSRKFKTLQLQQLDSHIAEIRSCERPTDGWIRAIRKSLGMSVSQLAKRMHVSQQAISQLEAKEQNDSITIKTLRKAAEAMNCRVVYAIIPNDGTLEDIVKNQALNKAREIILAVDRTMQLEAQGVGNAQAKIRETAEELASNPNSKLWENDGR